MTRPEVRRRMIAEAGWLVKECGFDGVQSDYDICPDDDPGFLALMRETRVALPRDALLSAACPACHPIPLGRYVWSERYFGEVAATCDQIALMCYDTGFWLPRSYVWLVRQQAIRVTSAVFHGDPRCQVLLGVPTYGRGFLSHNPRAETIGFALRGVREGLSDGRAHPACFAGIAPFADYTTDSTEWDEYVYQWLTPSVR